MSHVRLASFGLVVMAFLLTGSLPAPTAQAPEPVWAESHAHGETPPAQAEATLPCHARLEAPHLAAPCPCGCGDRATTASGQGLGPVLPGCGSEPPERRPGGDRGADAVRLASIPLPTPDHVPLPA